MDRQWKSGKKVINGSSYIVRTKGSSTRVRPVETWQNTAHRVLTAARRRVVTAAHTAAQTARHLEWSQLARNIHGTVRKHIRAAKKRTKATTKTKALTRKKVKSTARRSR